MIEKPSNAIGYVVFRKDRKRWTVRYPVYDAKTGKNINKAKDFKTREEAEKFLQTINYQKENPIFIEKNGIPLGELMRSILKLKQDSNQIGEATYARTLRTIEMIERYPIGTEFINEIRPEEIQEFMNDHKNLSNSTINKLYQMIGSTFKVAINKGYLMRDPMVNVLKPKSLKQDKKVRALTIEEQQALTDYLLSTPREKCKYKNVYLIQMFCGLRVGEALALSLKDIDLEHRKISVKKTLTKDERGRTIMGQSTKTYAGKRIVPIPEFIMPSIIEQMQYANSQLNNDEKMIFRPNNKKYCDRETVNDYLKDILKKEFDITDISTHSLRHTFGTRCVESGMQPVVVQRLMGHTDVSVTLNTYTSVYDKFKEQEIEKVNQYYLKELLYNNQQALDKGGFETDETLER